MAYQAYQSAKPERPTAVTVIAILFLAYGALCVVSLPINIAQAYGKMSFMMGPAAAMMQDPGMVRWMKISVPVSALFSILCIVLGIGLLQLLRWARKAAIAVIAIAMVAQVVNTAVAAPIMFRAMTAAMGSFGPGPQPPPELLRAIMVVGVAIGVVIVFGVGILFIVLLTRPNARYAFEPETDPNYAAYQAYWQQQQQYGQAPQSAEHPAAPDATQPPEGYPPAP